MIRILVISRTPWDSSNSFGNTFSNLFGGMPDVEIYSICCQSGSTQNDLVKQTLQMTEASVIRSLKGGSVAVSQLAPSSVNLELNVANIGRRKRKTWMFIARDIIWKLGSCKWKRAICNFVDEVKPNVIYLPVYPSWYMCQIDLYVIKYANVPVIAHISDNDYGNIPGISLTARWYHFVSRMYLRRILSRVSYIEVFANSMKEEYEKEFNKSCYVVGKGLSSCDVHLPKKQSDTNELHFVYTGGIGGERYEVLMHLARTLNSIDYKKCVLDVYSTTQLSEDMMSEIAECEPFIFHGAISPTDVIKVQEEADFLVYVEGFSTTSIASTRMSFSTKIPDYLSTGNVMLAIGPSGINSIDVLRDKGISVVCDDLSKLSKVVLRLVNRDYDLAMMQQRAYEYLTTECDKKNIQKGILERMKSLIQ